MESEQDGNTRTQYSSHRHPEHLRKTAPCPSSAFVLLQLSQWTSSLFHLGFGRSSRLAGAGGGSTPSATRTRSVSQSMLCCGYAMSG